MKVFKHDRYKTVCGSALEWNSMKKEFDEGAKVSIFDLRTLLETGGQPLQEIPAGWKVEPHPISGETISEQDFDVFRREVRRHGNFIAVGVEEARGSLMVLADAARRERRGFEEREVSSLSGIDKEATLKRWLEAYLERHRTTDAIGEF